MASLGGVAARLLRRLIGTVNYSRGVEAWPVDDGSSAATNHYIWGLDLSGSAQGAGGIGGDCGVGGVVFQGEAGPRGGGTPGIGEGGASQ